MCLSPYWATGIMNLSLYWGWLMGEVIALCLFEYLADVVRGMADLLFFGGVIFSRARRRVGPGEACMNRDPSESGDWG